MGPWGAGKTSVLKMLCEALDAKEKAPIVIEVNPWLFSGTEQLVELFIRMRTRMHLGSIEGRRAAIGGALTDANERLLVLVDDIDRLTDQEIRDVVRTVRLVGDFDNVTYLLAFDRVRVEKALGDRDDPRSGRDYLEKIVQTIHPLPAIRYGDLTDALTQGIVNAVGDLDHGTFVPYEWQNIGGLAVRPLFNSLRDVYRFTNVLPATIRAIGDEVALHDVLALEAVRVLEPDVWDAIVNAAPALGYTRDLSFGGGGEARTAAMKPLVDAVITAAGANAGPVEQLLERVFPASQAFLSNHHYGTDSLRQWRRERRVAHPAVFAIYLQRTPEPAAVPAALVDAVFESLATSERTDELLSAASAAQLEELLDRLEAWEHDFPPPTSQVVVAFMRQMERLRTGRRAMFDMGADLALDRVVLRILRRSEDEAQRLTAVKGALAADISLTAKRALLQIVGYDENAGHKLIPEPDSKRLDKQLAKEISVASPEALRHERDLRRLIYWSGSKGGKPAQAKIRQLLEDDGVLARLIQSSKGESISQGMGDVGERRTVSLSWDWLQSLRPMGELERHVAGLRERLDAEILDDDMTAALELAERYAAGWRPDERDR